MSRKDRLEPTGRRGRRIRRALLAFLGIAALVGFGVTSVGKQLRTGNDFPIYHEAARTLLAASSPYDVATGLHGYVYLPFLALALAPLAALPLAAAAAIWYGLNLVLAFLAVRAAAATLRDGLSLPVRPWMVVVVLVPLAGFFADNLALGQANLLLLALATLALQRLIRSGDGWVAGSLLGLAAAIKPNMALLAAPLLIRFMGRSAGGFLIAAATAGLALPLVTLGPERTTSLLSQWQEKVIAPARSETLQGSKIFDQSPQAGLRRFLVAAPAFQDVSVNVAALSPSRFATASRILSASLALGLLACWFRRRREATREALLLDLALASCGTLLLLGFNLKAHFVALLVPGMAAVVLCHARAEGRGRTWGLMLLTLSGVLLLASNPGLAGRGVSNWVLAYSSVAVAALTVTAVLAYLRLTLRVDPVARSAARES